MQEDKLENRKLINSETNIISTREAYMFCTLIILILIHCSPSNQPVVTVKFETVEFYIYSPIITHYNDV